MCIRDRHALNHLRRDGVFDGHSKKEIGAFHGVGEGAAAVFLIGSLEHLTLLFIEVVPLTAYYTFGIAENQVLYPCIQHQLGAGDAGGAGIACAKLMLDAGVKDLILCDSKGIVCSERDDLNEEKREMLPVSYTHLRAHETRHDLVCRLL